MDGSIFNLSSENAKDLTDEVISLVGGMFLVKKNLMRLKS